jgi:O-antigen/teichoic acid export membrane protein
LNKFKQKIIKNIWLKISFFNAFAVFARIISGWIINKAIAIYIGPEGTSLTEQFRNFLQTAQGFATMGISEGVTKYAAKYQNNKKQLSSFLASTYKIVLITSIIVGAFLVLFSGQINHQLFGQRDFSLLIMLTGILIPVLSINIILLAILNGFQKYKKITYINIISNITSALIAIFLVKVYGLIGSLILIIATQLISFITTLFFIRADMVELLNFSLKNSKTIHYKRLYSYIIMALVTAIVIPLFSILIRNLIFNFYTDDNGIHAGYWDAVKKISGLLLAFITPIFSLYYYPQLAKIRTNKEFKLELKKFYKQIFPLFLTALIILFLLKYWAILLFFSKAYLPMKDLFAWQLAGDLIRIMSLTIAFLMLAKSHVIKYIATEIGFWIIYYGLSCLLINHYQLKGVVIAYFITYILYFVSLLILYRKILFTKKTVKL